MAIEFKENKKGYKVLTPDGYKSFAGIRKIDDRPVFRAEFSNSFWLECTDNHKLFTSNDIRKPITEILPGDTVLTHTGEVQLLSLTNTGRIEPVYDLIEVEDGHRYYTNSLLSSNCEFIIDEETLIAPAKLFDLKGVDPLYRTGQVRWYKRPEPNKMYIVAHDPSLGTGSDPAAIQIFDATTTEQIGEWRHNKTPIPEQVRILVDIVTHIHDIVKDPNSIYYSVENNTLGEAALISIAEYGEENIKGYFLSDNSSSVNKRLRKGFNTTAKSKLVGCSKLKNLIESGKMKINSVPLVSELKCFVAKGTSYSAKPGETDDLVMATVLAVRMLQLLQTYHRDIDENLRDFADSMVEPMPFISMLR